MSLALDLLEQAHHLSIREKKRPKQASLRRSISTAYYALFHLLTSEAAIQLAPAANEQTRASLQRWFDHQQMQRACGFFSGLKLSSPADKIFSDPLSPDLRSVARAFVQLQQLRHSADYDVATTWTRLQAQQSVQVARDAFGAWSRVRRSAEGNLLLLALLDLKRLQSERT